MLSPHRPLGAAASAQPPLRISHWATCALPTCTGGAPGTPCWPRKASPCPARMSPCAIDMGCEPNRGVRHGAPGGWEVVGTTSRGACSPKFPTTWRWGVAGSRAIGTPPSAPGRPAPAQVACLSEASSSLPCGAGDRGWAFLRTAGCARAAPPGLAVEPSVGVGEEQSPAGPGPCGSACAPGPCRRGLGSWGDHSLPRKQSGSVLSKVGGLTRLVGQEVQGRPCVWVEQGRVGFLLLSAMFIF